MRANTKRTGKPARWLQGLVACGLLLAAGAAMAADQCPALRGRQSDPEVATRIAAIACDEHVLWNRPFIDANGRLASSAVYEAESRGLQDGGSPWRRVAFYWQSAGLLSPMAAKSGATDCNYAINSTYPGLGCRGFVVDNPWSAAFITWVMQRAGVPGFVSSASHFDYVRAARTNPDRSPYRFLDPMAAAPSTGDLLCYVRTNRVYGFRGLADTIDGGASGLPMHCDAVVASNPGGNGKAYAVGGNVQQAVTMRELNLNASGQLWGVPQRTEGDVECSPDTQGACNFNRQDWAVLLKLKPQAELALIGPVQPPNFLPNQVAPQACCVNCVVGSGIPRCPAPGQSPLQPQPQTQLQGSE